MTKKVNTNELVLTAEQIEEQGRKIMDIMKNLEALHNFSNTMMLLMYNGTDNAIKLSALSDFLSAVYDQTEMAYKDLDKVAVLLLECDNLKNLKDFEVRFGGDKA
ncbi:hypothetical protein [uncultured Streptococcus sp.]|uniref:hypothetical protein n=1 Tax=uncultured Streptococcus sp. TaxID=83427 RepID=UPI0027DB0CA8|nr:hypothetical protein [uncultured Streptococcus sp.]